MNSPRQNMTFNYSKDFAKTKATDNLIVESFAKHDPRYNQRIETLQLVEEYKTSIILIATSWGNSEIDYETISRRDVLLVHAFSFASPIEKQVKAPLIDVGLIGDRKMKFAHVVFGNGLNVYQTIESPITNDKILAVVAFASKNKTAVKYA